MTTKCKEWGELVEKSPIVCPRFLLGIGEQK